MFEAFEEDGDGGLTEQEAIVAEQQLHKIQQDLNKQVIASSVRDKAALEKWKMEQLSEKSEGSEYRGRDRVVPLFNLANIITISGQGALREVRRK